MILVDTNVVMEYKKLKIFHRVEALAITRQCLEEVLDLANEKRDSLLVELVKRIKVFESDERKADDSIIEVAKENDFKVAFKEIRNNINLDAFFIEKLQNYKANYENSKHLEKILKQKKNEIKNLTIKYITELKNVVIKPNIAKFLIDFRDLQIKYQNGKLIEKFEELTEVFMFTVLRQSIKLYDKYDIHNTLI